MKEVDLRSDTVTRPTEAMRKAMSSAVVGDDVYGEDPTVNLLQRTAAEMLGKESALFVPSGTMGNLAAVLAHCNRGDEIILGDRSHTFLFEAGGIAALGGVHPFTLPNQPDGTLDLEAIEGSIRADNPHYPRTRLIALESTHNRCGGIPLTLDYLHSVAELAKEKGLAFHLDGARIFNAAAALSVPPAKLVEPVDSVMFCLSKGLGAPVGSILCGSAAFIQAAVRIRKQLGGGMRQAGVIAAAGVVALENVEKQVDRDHRLAAKLAEGLRSIPGVQLDYDPPPTNMVYVSLASDFFSAEVVSGQLKELGILVGVVGKRQFRLVTHQDVDEAGIQRAVEGLAQVCGSG